MAIAQMTTPLLVPAHRHDRAGWLFGHDPLGLMAGWRAFRTYEALKDLNDAALAAKGLTRNDLPVAALNALKRAL